MAIQSHVQKLGQIVKQTVYLCDRSNILTLVGQRITVH